MKPPVLRVSLFGELCHYGLTGPDLVIGISADSNNSSRSFFSYPGGLITFDGAGCGFGQCSGLTAGPLFPQADNTSTQVSHNSSRDGLGGLAVFFMLGSDAGQCLALFVFGLPGVLHCLNLPGELGHLLPALGQISGSVAPLTAQQAAEQEQPDAGEDVGAGNHTATRRISPSSAASDRSKRSLWLCSSAPRGERLG